MGTEDDAVGVGRIGVATDVGSSVVGVGLKVSVACAVGEVVRVKEALAVEIGDCDGGGSVWAVAAVGPSGDGGVGFEVAKLQLASSPIRRIVGDRFMSC